MKIEPVVLKGRTVTLEPLRPSHLPGLCEAGLDPELWQWTPNQVGSVDDMAGYLETAMEEERQGRSLPFAVIANDSGKLAGSTRYGNIDAANRRLEIGWTWYARPWQRTAVNTESKYLLLRHAFETLGAMRVEFKTDALNRRSRDALLRIGAREEGIFRNHMLTWSGRIRNTVYFSIIDSEWPAVKQDLESKLAGRQQQGPVPIDRLTDSQIEDLHHLYQSEWWTKGRRLEDVRRLIDNSQLVAGFSDPATNRLLAFARVITDSVYKALILDVIVAESHRHSGLGRALMDRIVAHPKLGGVRHLELYCRPELVPFYRKWGFELPDPGFNFMRRADNQDPR